MAGGRYSSSRFFRSVHFLQFLMSMERLPQCVKPTAVALQGGGGAWEWSGLPGAHCPHLTTSATEPLPTLKPPVHWGL